MQSAMSGNDPATNPSKSAAEVSFFIYILQVEVKQKRTYFYFYFFKSKKDHTKRRKYSRLKNEIGRDALSNLSLSKTRSGQLEF